MFKIFTFRQLAIMAFCICLVMLLGASLNALSPFVAASSDSGIKIPVIMYHHVCDKKALWGDYVIPQTLLRDDFDYFKRNNITPISFEQLAAFTENGTPLPQKCVVLTFDDGEKSFLTKVVPLLQEYNYPANVNVVGSLIELYTQNKETNDTYAYLNENDIKKLSEHPLVELGCHTYNCHSLGERKGIGRIPGEADSSYTKFVTEDLVKFEELLTRITGEKPRIFAYPFGIRSDYLLNIVKDRGYTVTLTCRESVNTLNAGDELYELGRFNRPYGKSPENYFSKIFN